MRSTKKLSCLSPTMELLSYLLLLFLALLFLYFSTMRNKYKPSTSPAKDACKLPPGPSSLPIIGSIHHVLGSLPHHSLANLAKTYGPLMHLKLGEVSTIVVSSPEVAQEFLKTHDVSFAKRPQFALPKVTTYGYKDIMFAPYGEYWRELRKICTLELFTAKRVQSFRSIRDEEASNLVRSIYATTGFPINLSAKTSELSNDITMRSVIGNKCKDQKEFLSAVTESIEAMAVVNLADVFPSSALVRLISGVEFTMKRAYSKLDPLVTGILREHKERQMRDIDDEDLLGVLLRLQKQGGLQIQLEDDNIKAVILDMFGAGSDTSATTLEWAMSELMRNPEAMKKAQTEVRDVLKGKPKISEEDLREMKYMKMVIKETLRLHPPAPLIPRECTKTCTILGYDILERDRVILNAYVIGRDPRYWPEAGEFMPERFDGSKTDFKGNNYEFIPFGAGRRMCAGVTFGIATIETALANLLYYFNWRLPTGVEPGNLDMTEAMGATIHRKFNLCLFAEPFVPCPPVA